MENEWQLRKDEIEAIHAKMHEAAFAKGPQTTIADADKVYADIELAVSVAAVSKATHWLRDEICITDIGMLGKFRKIERETTTEMARLLREL